MGWDPVAAQWPVRLSFRGIVTGSTRVRIFCCAVAALIFMQQCRPCSRPRDSVDVFGHDSAPSTPAAAVPSVVAYSVYCASPADPSTQRQVRWLRSVADSIVQKLPLVRPGAILHCRAVGDLLRDAFRGSGFKLQPLPVHWDTGFNWVRMNALLLSEDLWSNLLGDKILFFQPDVYLCPSAQERLMPMLSYDYVGAPWSRGYDRGCPLGVGNGGFSLRSRNHSLRVLRNPRTPSLIKEYRARNGPNEDLIWCHLFTALGANVPRPEVAASFSVENDDFGVLTPMGAHDCAYQTTIVKLEAGCPGITAFMTAVQRHKRPWTWIFQERTYFVWWAIDRGFVLWVQRCRLATALTVVALVYSWVTTHVPTYWRLRTPPLRQS